MSIKGQNTKSIRKKSLTNTRLPVVGTKSIVMFHEASLGEQYIDLTNLVLPSGHTNPSPSEILKARIKDFENNFELVSSSKGRLMKPLSYEVVSNSTIKLKVGVEEGEIFEGKLHSYTINGTLIADVRTPQGSGELLEGQTDFNLGEAIRIENTSSQWPIQLFRGTTGRPMLRNTLNAPYIGDDSIGNYQMVDRGDGWCQVIRFNLAGNVGNEPVMWANHGALGERPDLSVLQRVDKINGIMDKMREDLYALTGNDVEDPTRYDNGVPTNSDLKAFGDLIFKLLNVEIPNSKNKQTYSLLQSTNAVTDFTNEIRFNLGTATIEDSGIPMIIAEDDSVNGRTKFIAQRKCHVFGSFATPINANVLAGVTKNGIVQKAGSSFGTGNGNYSHVSVNIELEAGEYFTVTPLGTGRAIGGVIPALAAPMDLSFTAIDGTSSKIKDLI